MFVKDVIDNMFTVVKKVGKHVHTDMFAVQSSPVGLVWLVCLIATICASRYDEALPQALFRLGFESCAWYQWQLRVGVGGLDGGGLAYLMKELSQS